MPRKRREQQEIPGTEAPKHPEVEEAAETYVGFRDERITLQDSERAAKKTLVDTMQQHGVTTYRYVDGEGVTRIVTAETKVNAKVSKDRKAKDEDGFVASGDEDVTVQ